MKTTTATHAPHAAPTMPTPATYPGQCIHTWTPDPSRPTGCERCTAPGCHAIATRGRDGLIDTYDSGIRDAPHFTRFALDAPFDEAAA